MSSCSTSPCRSATASTCSLLRQRFADLPVLILSTYPEDQYAINLIRVGASGYLTKESAADELVKAIRTVVQGRRYVSAAVAELLIGGLGKPTEQSMHQSLSEREFQIFCKLSRGQTVSVIADELFLSVKTVSTYRSRILEKMGMKTNADLTYYAIKNGRWSSRRGPGTPRPPCRTRADSDPPHPAYHPTMPDRATVPAFPPLRVLLIEDSAMIRGDVARISAGDALCRTVDWADTEHLGISMFAAGGYQVAIIDLQLRRGNGVNVLRAMRARAPGIRIVYTNHAQVPAYRRQCADAGADYFFDKSLEMEEVFRVIEEYAGSRAAGDPS